MNILASILLSFSSNLDTLSVSTLYRLKKLRLAKNSSILFAIITSLSTLFSMLFGSLIAKILPNNLTGSFGNTLLLLVGIYFIVEYIRMKKKNRGEDTSYYVESTSQFQKILENPEIADINNSGNIDINEALSISLALSKNNAMIGIAAGIMGINIGLCVLFNFVFSIVCSDLSYFIANIKISKCLSKYNNLISGIILIIIVAFKICLMFY